MATRILVAVVLAPLFFVVLFFLPPVWLAAVMAAISAMAAFELLRAPRVAHPNGAYVLTVLAAALIPLGYWVGLDDWGTRAVAVVLMCGLFLLAVRLYGTEQAMDFEHVMVCLFGGVAIPLFLSALVQLKEMENGRYLVLLPVICAFLTDAGAYFAGVFLGRHRGITKVSPVRRAGGVPAHSGGVRSGGQRRHRAGRPGLLLCEAAVRGQGLRPPPPGPRGDAGPVRLHGVRRPHAAAAGGAGPAILIDHPPQPGESK